MQSLFGKFHRGEFDFQDEKSRGRPPIDGLKVFLQANAQRTVHELAEEFAANFSIVSKRL